MIFIDGFIGNLGFSLVLVLCCVAAPITASKSPRNASLTDLSKCKLTQFGTEYMGFTMTTAGGIRCQMWHSEKPIHKVSETITDTDFPERSRRLARNYCRNPTRDPRGPWCFTMEATLIDDACEVPLCNFGECRISGTGSEYGGTHQVSSSGKQCKSWDKRLKQAVNKTEKFSNNHFSDLSRNKAKNFCRNPDSSTGGPWCYVDSEDYDVVVKEYCSVPFCDDKDCLVYSKNASTYSILTNLNISVGNITFWIKLWNPADQQVGQARMLFSNLQVPTSAEVIAQQWRAGVEIVISNSGSGQDYPRTDDEADFEDTPNIILGSKWTGLWVAWGGGFISVGYHGSIKPIFLDEFKKKNTISSMYPESFFQYGIMGTGVLWSMQFCEEACEVHTTFGIEFIRAWPLLQSNTSHDLQFHVRASHQVTIQLTQTPAVPYPCFLIVLGQHNATLVMYQETETSLKEILLDLETKHILDFWAWNEFTISIFGMAMQMFWHRDYGREQVFSVKLDSVQTMRWFSIGSENTIAHWTLFCAPTEADAIEAPWFPNCVASGADARYEGSQWTTRNQIPCIPWVSNKIPEDQKKDEMFIDGSALRALNKCRNPTNDPEGPYCYTATQLGNSSAIKQYCPIRRCRSSECRMAGTANDYLGTLSVTRSGRTCAPWLTEYEEPVYANKPSLRSLMERSFISLKMKRENALQKSILNMPSQRWDEMGLRLREPRELDFRNNSKLTTEHRNGKTVEQYTEHKPLRYRRSPLYPKTEWNAIVNPDDDSNQSSDDDDEGIDLFNMKLGTIPHDEILKTTTARPNDNKFIYSSPKTIGYHGVFKTTSTSSSNDDDDIDGIDLFNMKPGTSTHIDRFKTTTARPNDNKFNYQNSDTIGHREIFKTTPKSSSHDNDDDGIDMFNMKPATFPNLDKFKATTKQPTDNRFIYSKPGTSGDYPGIFKTTSSAPELNFNTSPGTTVSQKTSVTTPRSLSDNDDVDDDDNGVDLFNMKLGTIRHSDVLQTTISQPTPDKFIHSKPETTTDYPGIFKTTPISSTNGDSSDDNPDTTEQQEISQSTYKSTRVPNLPTGHLSSVSDVTSKPKSEKFAHQTSQRHLPSGTTISSNEKKVSKPIHKVDPNYLNDTLYPEQSIKNASSYCRDPSRNIAGTWCYTTDPEVPVDLCNVRDCEQPEECTFFVRGVGTGRRLYVLPEYRSEGLRFSLKEWEPDHPDSITFVILSEDDVKSRLILKVGAMKNEKVLLYYETKENGIKLVKHKTLPHLLYLGRWTGFLLRMSRGSIKLYYEGAPYPLFEWEDPEPATAFLPVYYYYSSELSNTIGVAFDCHTKCHIEQTTTSRISRILPLSIWETEETPSPHRLVLMLRGEGVAFIPLLLMPATPGYYGLTLGDFGTWVLFIKNRYPVVHIYHKQDTNGPLFVSDGWTNITIQFYDYTLQVFRNGTQVFHYVHHLPLLFYFFSLGVDRGGWVTWAANCVPTDVDGDPLDGGWSEWGPWACSASCNGGMGVRKRICNNPEPNIRGQPCLGPSTSSGHCNMNKCGDAAEGNIARIQRFLSLAFISGIVVTLELVRRRIRTQQTSIIVQEGDGVTLLADQDIISAFRNESPTAEINWSRNGIFLEEEEDRIKLEDTAVSISYTVVNDSGVYTQTLHRSDDSHLIFKIITLAVVPTRTELVTRETLSFSVTCHCVVLGYIYSDLTVSWILNGRVYKDFGVSTPIAVNVDYVPRVNTSHHGEWRCEVFQHDLNFKWTTNVIKVRVQGPPNWRTHLMEDKLTRPIFGWMPSERFVAFSAFFLTSLIIVTIIASTIWYLRFRESLKYKDTEKRRLIDSEDSFSESETEKLVVGKNLPK